jgi:UDP-N-acetylglucosamine 2-epimerase
VPASHLSEKAEVKVLTIVGARPQFVKAAAVSKVLRATHDEVLLHTGQHYDDNMSELFFRELRIPAPAHNLGVGSGPHGVQTAAMIAGIEPIAMDERPDVFLVYGDTNSTLAGSLVAAKLNIPLAHVEAGMRSFDRRMPEEVNRILSDHVASLLFCPTQSAVKNLAREGITSGVQMVGDVMYDVLLANLPVARDGALLRDVGIAPGEYVLATLHRAENTDDPEVLSRILLGLGEAGMPVLLPMHPRTRLAIDRFGLELSSNIHAVEPVGYLEMIRLESSAAAIATDSGGVQKEAYMVGRPCVTLRDRTEWPETVEAGWNTLVGSSIEAIANAVVSFRPTHQRPLLFGDGRAAERIVAALVEYFGAVHSRR